MGIISSQDWKEIAKLYSNEETSAATRAGLCHNNNDHIPHLVQCPGLYSVQSTCVQWGQGQVHAVYCTVQPRTALSPGQSLRVTQRYTLLPSVTQCYSVSHVTRDRVTRSVCVVLMNSEGGSHGHIANIVAASNVTLQHIYNWQVNALSVRRFSECLFLQAVRNLQNLVDIAKTHINYRNICRETDVE